MESSTSAMIGALDGINMISGAVMLVFLASLSPEKLVIDSDIGMAKRMLKGMLVQTTPLAADMYGDINFKGKFLKKRLAHKLIKEEQYLPSAVIDRGSIRTWQQLGSTDTLDRAKTRLSELLNAYQPPDLPADQVVDLKDLVSSLASAAGMDKLPPLE